MENNVYLYPYSAGEAHRRDEVSLWRSSHQANIACKQAIEESIREHFDGMHLGDGCLENVLKCFGYKRTGWVLANTIQQKEWDGRFSPANRQWSKQTYIPPDPQHNSDFDTLKESCWSQENQLWLAHDGFGCRPNAIGRSIRCTCLGDGEMTRWNRTDFTGVLKEKFLPDWAKEKLADVQGQNPGMGGINMT